MAVKSPEEMFVNLLSHTRHTTERSAKIYEELTQLAQDPDVKEALESRAWICQKDLSAIDKCFELIGQKPVKFSGRLEEVFVEDFRNELAEIQNPVAKALFVLAKALHLNQRRIAEYLILVAAADISGHYAVGLLLESCLSDKMAFMERNRRLIRKAIGIRLEERVAA